MSKHSLTPASAPTSPAVTRSKADRHPVTPQRVARSAQLRHVSPYTPATTLSTPYTPYSLRSLSSSNDSSIATPASATNRRRLSLSLSPDDGIDTKSLADIAENWRTRANENGIKVASSMRQHRADESSLDIGSCIDKALLPAPFLSTHRRPRAVSQAQVPLSQITDPTQLCTPSRALHPPGILNTPPPQPAFRLRGSVTDPAHTRRRPPFEQTSELFDIDEDEYTPYPPAFSSASSQTLPIALTDPFNLQSDLSAISEPIQFHGSRTRSGQPEPKTTNPVFACSVCASAGGALAILEPCAHPLCSACLTSALNIVGEKDMECAVCKAKVDNFQLCKSPPTASERQCIKRFQSNDPTTAGQHAYSNVDGTDNSNALLPSAFENSLSLGAEVEFGDQDDFMDRAQGSSTPIAATRTGHHGDGKSEERAVLRIDNVPWDITPPAIAAWLKQPVERVHVLLDRKGKTLSHAYAEMASADAAKAALRGSQNAVLGRGKRARGVTVTRSGQEELMRALFPSWQGNFDGSRPSLAGLSNEHVISTLQRGLLSEAELSSLMHLIRSPDSHFLKVPSLPFHSLISILSKFPADDDSRVFWSGTLRDALYEVTYAAVQVLLLRIEENPLSDWTTVMTQVVRAAMDCQAFTSEQMSKLSDILEAALPRSASSPPDSRSVSHSPASPGSSPRHQFPTRINCHTDTGCEAYGELAKEFGVEADVVEALVRRLSEVC
ncbi:hypothetical protein AcV5_000379 [Taiwanofungus camphoratus]|nr:hypothetical protein AcV5_000379 [Antrodia cinnamomea]